MKKEATDPANIWVLRNPNLTHTMMENSIKTGIGYAEDRARAVPGFGFDRDEEWRCLNDLPTCDTTAANVVPIEALTTSAVYPCFICGEPLTTLPHQPRWIDVRSDFYSYRPKRKKGVKVDPAVSKKEAKNENVMRCLMKHCKETHAGDMFHFLHKAGLMSIGSDTPYTVQIHLQKVFRKGLEARGHLEHELFQEALRKNNPMPLKLALSNLFGIIQGHFPYARKELKGISKYAAYNGSAVSAFLVQARESLNKIQHDFIAFDFRQVQDGVRDADIMRLWNLVNLFFRRGLFNDKPFLVIRNVTITEKTLEKFEEEMKPPTLEIFDGNMAPPEPPSKKIKRKGGGAAKRPAKKKKEAQRGDGDEPPSKDKEETTNQKKRRNEAKAGSNKRVTLMSMIKSESEESEEEEVVLPSGDSVGSCDGNL
jgi:hypothetical protein